MKRSLDVMVAAAGRPELVKRTLESIAACVKPARYCQTLVIENGPQRGIDEIVRAFPSCHAFRYLYLAEANKCSALNLGLQHCSGGLVVFTDDDVRVPADWLTAYAAAADEGAAGRFYGGPVHIDAEYGLPPEWLRSYYPATLAVPWTLPHSGRPALVAGRTFMGTNWAAYGDELLEAGGFDPRLGPGTAMLVGDETEIQKRLQHRGSLPIYVPDAKVWHYLHPDYLAPQWLLRRTYRHGVAWGISKTRDGQPWLKSVVQGGVRCLSALVQGGLLRLAGGERRQFRARYLEARANGRWEGLWLGRQWQ